LGGGGGPPGPVLPRPTLGLPGPSPWPGQTPDLVSRPPDLAPRPPPDLAQVPPGLPRPAPPGQPPLSPDRPSPDSPRPRQRSVSGVYRRHGGLCAPQYCRVGNIGPQAKSGRDGPGRVKKRVCCKKNVIKYRHLDYTAFPGVFLLSFYPPLRHTRHFDRSFRVPEFHESCLRRKHHYSYERIARIILSLLVDWCCEWRTCSLISYSLHYSSGPAALSVGDKSRSYNSLG